jgi:uncharacterized protein (TIGR00725 family)
MSIQIAVVGGSDANSHILASAETVGAALASAGVTVVCGGLGGVMAAACRGAKAKGGLTVGIVPGSAPPAANEWVDVIIASGLGEARNGLVVGSAAAVIAIGGAWHSLRNCIGPSCRDSGRRTTYLVARAA